METPRILFTSADFAVLDKPPGWLSIPSRDPVPGEPVVSHWLGAHLSSPVRVVHRLDRFTSGVMIFALNEESHRAANEWFRTRSVKKIYRFIASPVPARPAIQIRTPVDGKPAQTLFEVLESRGRIFLGKATPLTGRFHQIRDDAKVAGFPILGDKAYGGEPAPRVCLHAASLETPIGNFTAPFAPDLQAFWETLHHAD
ncbi:MAG: RNA pseudouridine synthase [Proteobacteria bacterium]|nr:RNA pseudouridine synthase [Pseudomonadota bacterium]